MKDENTLIEYKKSLAQLKEGVISLSSMLKLKYISILIGLIFQRKRFLIFLMKLEQI